MRAPALLVLTLLCACAPAKPSRPPIELDCGLGYEGLSQRVMADPGLAQAPREPGEPYRFYRPTGGGPTFVFTEPGAPGHPAVFRQQAVHANGRKTMKTAGCPYGDRKGYEQVMAYLQSLS